MRFRLAAGRVPAFFVGEELARRAAPGERLRVFLEGYDFIDEVKEATHELPLGTERGAARANEVIDSFLASQGG